LGYHLGRDLTGHGRYNQIGWSWKVAHRRVNANSIDPWKSRVDPPDLTRETEVDKIA
jgi:hypothetical protein